MKKILLILILLAPTVAGQFDTYVDYAANTATTPNGTCGTVVPITSQFTGFPGLDGLRYEGTGPQGNDSILYYELGIATVMNSGSVIAQVSRCQVSLERRTDGGAWVAICSTTMFGPGDGFDGRVGFHPLRCRTAYAPGEHEHRLSIIQPPGGNPPIDFESIQASLTITKEDPVTPVSETNFSETVGLTGLEFLAVLGLYFTVIYVWSRTAFFGIQFFSILLLFMASVFLLSMFTAGGSVAWTLLLLMALFMGTGTYLGIRSFVAFVSEGSIQA